MIISVRNVCSDFSSYRAARVKSLFNAESGCNFDLDVELPVEGGGWSVGVIVGPSGSGKTSIGRQLFGGDAIYAPDWPNDAPIVDVVAPDGDFDAVTGAFAAVGLGDVPAWLRPYPVLSAGEQFRANLARVVAEAPKAVVVDEFTSVVDRQIARIGSMAFAKAWRRTGGQAVLLTPHYDVLDWLEPDWVLDTADGSFSKEGHHRPSIEVDVYETGWSFWRLFEPHHYLRAGPMPFGKAFVAFVGDLPVAHLGVSSLAAPNGKAEARACRMVVMPEWQGAGVGTRLLNLIAQRYLDGEGHLAYPTRTVFHTNHPGLCAALRRDPRWRQISASLYGDRLAKSRASIIRSGGARIGFGGHFRAVQGFRYYGR